MQGPLGNEGQGVETIFRAPARHRCALAVPRLPRHAEGPPVRDVHAGALRRPTRRRADGEEYVEAMCHDIEDPTLDATTLATNPRARMRPVPRPPRVPADRMPHCEWVVDIDESRDQVEWPRGLRRRRPGPSTPGPIRDLEARGAASPRQARPSAMHVGARRRAAR